MHCNNEAVERGSHGNKHDSASADQSGEYKVGNAEEV